MQRIGMKVQIEKGNKSPNKKLEKGNKSPNKKIRKNKLELKKKIEYRKKGWDLTKKNHGQKKK